MTDIPYMYGKDIHDAWRDGEPRPFWTARGTQAKRGKSSTEALQNEPSAR